MKMIIQFKWILTVGEKRFEEEKYRLQCFSHHNSKWQIRNITPTLSQPIGLTSDDMLCIQNKFVFSYKKSAAEGYIRRRLLVRTMSLCCWFSDNIIRGGNERVKRKGRWQLYRLHFTATLPKQEFAPTTVTQSAGAPPSRRTKKRNRWW